MSTFTPGEGGQRKPKGWLLAIIASMCMLLVCVPFLGPPRFNHFRDDCVATLQKAPNAESVEAWLVKNRIPYSRKEAPYDRMFEEVLELNGIARSQVKQSRLCLLFENVPVRGGFPARHFAYGYFLFSADGSVVGYKIFDAYQSL